MISIVTINAVQTTTNGITLNYTITTPTSSPERITMYDLQLTPSSYANRESDITSSQITFTGHVTEQYPHDTYIAVYKLSDLTTNYCTSDIEANPVCTINYATYPPSTSTTLFYCNEFGGCSRGIIHHFQKDSGEFVQTGIKLSFSSEHTTTTPNRNTLFSVASQTNNYFTRTSDPALKTLTYTGHLHSNYPFESYYKIINKSDLTDILCQSSFADNNCVISYTTSAPSQHATYYQFCNAFGGCSQGISTYYFGGYTGELSGPSLVLTYTLFTDLITPPQYIYPTPTNGARKYNPQNFTIKINATGNNLDNAIITINSQNYSMQNTSDIYYYTYNFTDITSIETVTFQVHYNKSGTVNSIEQRTAYAYPPRESAGQVPFTTPIVYLLSLILILIPLSIKTKSKNKSKKAIGPVVATALLLVVAVVALISFQGWYQTYQSDILSKTERKSNIDSSIIFIERTEQTTSGTNIMIRNQGSAYYVITELKINSQQCNLLGSDIIGENTVTTIETDCTSIRNQAAEIAVFTDLGIFSEEEMVR
jgi:hypothetical protein